MFADFHLLNSEKSAVIYYRSLSVFVISRDEKLYEYERSVNGVGHVRLIVDPKV